MTIAIVGPEKFAFQDLVCVDLAFRLGRHEQAQLFAEPRGSEDAKVCWRDDGVTRTLEVQVKGGEADVTLEDLACFLAHFPERQAAGTLLERLMQDPERRALFVLSGRCEDRLRPLIAAANWAGEAMTSPSVSGLGGPLAVALSHVPVGELRRPPTKLQIARRRHLADLSRTPPSALADALARVRILEQVNGEQVEVRLHQALMGRGIDSDRLRGAIAQLTDCITDSKKAQNDALVAMQAVLARLAPPPMAPTGYVARGVEDRLAGELAVRGFLLLAGPPRTGKTWIARALAGRLQTRGFEVRTGPHVDEAERFLTDPSQAERAYLLDDPLGDRALRPDGHVRFAALESLVRRLPPGRRLIVAQTEAPVLELAGRTTLAASGLAGEDWHRVGELSAPLAIAVWREVGRAQGLDPAALDHVVGLIQTRTDLRDAGAIAYLAQTYKRLGPDPSTAQILMQAREDAQSFARELAASQREAGRVLEAAALATEPGVGVADAELAFVIDGGCERPSLQDVDRLGNDDDSEPSNVLGYATQSALTDVQNQALVRLQRQRVLEERAAANNFTHPYLRAGAQGLLRPDVPRDMPRLVAQIERALACIDPATALAAARNLSWVWSLFEPCEGGVAALVDIAESGLRSLFPAVRDACFDFLMSRAEYLPEERLENARQWAEVAMVDIDSITVRGGVAVIDVDQVRYRDPDPLDTPETIRPFLDAMETGLGLDLDIMLARRILDVLARAPEAMSRQVASRFLSADESLVRAEAMSVWLSVSRQDDDGIFDRLQDDRSPAVSVAILRRLANHWSLFSTHRQERLVQVLLRHATSPGAASALFHRLVLFDRQEHFGANPPWSLFCRVAAVAIQHLPNSVTFDDGRLFNAVEEAIRAGERESLEPLLGAWVDRLMKGVGVYLASEYELAVVEPMLKAARPSFRLPLLRRLMAAPSTGAAMIFLADLIRGWEHLTAQERELTVDLLGDDRPDRIWLRAVALTQRGATADLLMAASGIQAPFELLPQNLEASLSAGQFNACVRVFVGSPQPLWALATHHSAETLWAPVVDGLARRPEHPLFPAALLELARGEDIASLCAAIEVLPDGALDQAFSWLLERKVVAVAFWLQKVWIALLDRGLRAGRYEAWFDRIDRAAPAIVERLGDVRLWLGDTVHAERLMGALTADLRAMNRLGNLVTMLEMVSDAGGPAAGSSEDIRTSVKAAVLETFVRSVADEPPRVLGVWSSIGEVFRREAAPQDLSDRLEVLRLEALKHWSDLKAAARTEAPYVPLEGWIGPGGAGIPA